MAKVSNGSTPDDGDATFRSPRATTVASSDFARTIAQRDSQSPFAATIFSITFAL